MNPNPTTSTTTQKTKSRQTEFWCEMTKKSSFQYCKQMLKLSEEDCSLTEDQFYDYFDRVFECKDRDMPEDYFESPFPQDIRGYIHEYSPLTKKFQPKHLMCKAAVLRDDTNHINFEFLIEYGIFESDVEIYYGIKAISDSVDTTDDFFNYVTMGKPMKSVDNIKNESNVKYTQRFKTTNNAHGGTFWLVWERIESTETLYEVIDILEKRYYNRFKRYNTDLEEIMKGRFDQIRKNLDKHSDIDINRFNELKEKYPIFKKFLEEATQPDSIHYGDKCKGIISEKKKDDRILTQRGEIYYFNEEFTATDVKFVIRWIFGYEWNGADKKDEKEGDDTIPFEQIKQVFRYGKSKTLTATRWQKKLDKNPKDWMTKNIYALINDIKATLNS
jgi:hypothetical protein